MCRVIILSAAYSICVLVSCNMSADRDSRFKTPEEYNEFLVDRHSGMINRINSFINQLGNDNDSARRLLESAKNYTITIISETNRLPSFRKDSVFRSAAMENFKFYKRKIDGEYRSMLELYESGEIETSDEYYLLIDPLFKAVAKEEEPYHKAFYNSQQDFAERFNMRLSKDANIEE